LGKLRSRPFRGVHWPGGGYLREQLTCSCLVVGMREEGMALPESLQLQGDRNGGFSRPVGLVTCPNCQVLMPRISLKPSETANDLNEASYRCPRCGTETRRWIAL
jgi:hypothetical protein